MAGVERALARAMFPEWALGGWSAARMIRRLKVLKIPTYRRVVMLRDIRSAIDTVQFTPKVMKLKTTVRIPKTIMVETELRRDAKYRILARVKERDLATGRITYPHKSIYTNLSGTKEDYAGEFMSVMEQKGADKYKFTEEIEILAIQHFKGYTY